MTAKRYFKEDFYNEYAIKKEDIIIAVVDSGPNARRICNELNALHEEKDYWKKRCLLVEKKYGELPLKVKLEDIIGLVNTDEPTNSVELKKELEE